MWTQSYSQIVQGVSLQSLWQAWTDINHWHEWQDDIEYAKLDGDFQKGASFQMKIKKGPLVNLQLVEVEVARKFTDLTVFPGAKMFGCHEFIVQEDRIEIKTTLSIYGWLSFLWRKIVGEGVMKSLPLQTTRLIAYAQQIEKK